MKLSKALALAILFLCIGSVLSVNVSYSQPASGDWVITGIETVQSKTITLNGNLIVRSGGNLTLNDVTLIMGSTYAGQYQILAEPHSTLTIVNSRITPSDNSYGPVFNVHSAGFVLKGSMLQLSSGIGWGPCISIGNSRGSILEDNNLVISGDGEGFQSGISLNGCENARFLNNTITPNGKVNIQLGIRNSNNTIISSNNLSFAFFMLQGSWNTSITANTLNVLTGSGSSTGLVISEGCGNNVVDGNTFNSVPGVNNVCTAFRLVGTSFPNVFTNNIIRGSYQTQELFGFKTGIMLSQTSNALIANNSFIDMPSARTNMPNNMWPNEAMQIYRSDRNQILNNFINSTNSGIVLFASSNNTLKGNCITDSGRGLSLYYSSDYNDVEGNSLENNFVNIVLDGADSNVVHGNNLISGSEYQAFDNSNNEWSANYWSDYLGHDRGDGYGDRPNYIRYNGIDSLPLVSRPLFKLVPTLAPASVAYEYVFSKEYMGSWPQLEYSGNVTIKDQTIALTENIVIQEGSSLTLENVTLTVPPSRNCSQYSIIVRPAATLHVIESKLLCNDKGPSLGIFVDKGAHLTLTRSELQNMGMCDTQEGPAIQLNEANGVVIEDNLITGSKHAILVSFSSNVQIVNNTISNSLFGVIIFYWENSVLTGNTISHSVHDSIVSGGASNSSIIGNTVSDAWGYLSLNMGPSSTVANNKIINYYGGYPGSLTVDPKTIVLPLSASFHTTDQINANRPVIFDASTSTAGTGSIVSYQWDLGDNTTATGISPSHTYASAGNYLVSLNVTNSEGLWCIKTEPITVQASVQAHSTSPSQSSNASSDQIQMQAQGLPQEAVYVIAVIIFIAAAVVAALIIRTRKDKN